MQQFVGGYKPYSGINSKGDHEVYYRFVFGPFLDTYVAALKHPEQRFLLIIEEINRANAAAVSARLSIARSRYRRVRASTRSAFPTRWVASSTIS